ncbi:MAG: ribonuclease HII [Acidobacteriales bacterium]|nr:ribonuclease HII [Terriglobales bacterium]
MDVPPHLSPSAEKMRLLKSLRCTQKYEKLAWRSGARQIAGVDETGRGCLFGPVVAAAVILDPDYRIRGLRDSKLITEPVRDHLAAKIRKHAIAIALAVVDVEIIDAINIYQASKLAMQQAVAQLWPVPDHLLVDAMTLDHPSAEQRTPQTPLIHGDALSVSIAAASIIAKVERDRMMRDYSAQYPLYDLANNKGYSAPKHLAALRAHGPTALHRRTFAPVWNALHPQEALAFMADAADPSNLHSGH